MCHRLLKNALPPQDATALQHLRRFAKEEYLPVHLRSDPSATTLENPKLATLHLLICLASTISLADLDSIFTSVLSLFEPRAPTIRTISVPEYPPTSSSQAADWSDKYWPIVYKNTNPYGPHPALVSRAQLELLADSSADSYISLAWDVGHEVKGLGHGLSIGAVVVERLAGKGARVVAVAGDGRHCGIQYEDEGKKGGTDGKGNVMAHAAMRAISMVAEKRLRLEQSSSQGLPADSSSTYLSDPFVTQPISPLEIQNFQPDTLSPHGYLCLDLEIYLTHEPCVMCAMAILHSRFGRVVFNQTMPRTGALSTEGKGLDYGLFWREQLNWKLLCWRWDSAEDEAGTDFAQEMQSNIDVHA
jgi:tRNA-specific adenosine deaminase 3